MRPNRSSLTVEPVVAGHRAALDDLFGADAMADRCWCLWFLIPVREFHDAGRDGNRRRMMDLIEESAVPMGLLAFDDEVPVGWCGVGPRARYQRAIRTPTLRGWHSPDHDTTWFVPCFFVRPGHRERGVAGALLAAAVAAARSSGATAIEGFPLSGDRRRSSGSDFQTGVEALFAAHGFEPVHRPSSNRVVMRRELLT